MSQSSLIQNRGGSSSACNWNHPVHKTLASAANLANLLPTSTVLAFNALIPSFSNNGTCHVSNKFLTLSVIVVCGVFCFVSSFTDSFVGSDGKLYYGIATFKGLYVFNYAHYYNDDVAVPHGRKYRLSFIDLVHAVLSVMVFLVFAFTNPNVQGCLIPHDVIGPNESALIINLPLAVGVLSTFLFTIFPTTRRGIGYSDMPHPPTSTDHPSL